MTNLSLTLTSVAIAIFILVTTAWILSVILRDASIIDIVWGPGFAIGCAVAFITSGGGSRAVITLVLVSIWATRLSLHILARNLGKGEDPRYQTFRQRAGPTFWWRSYFTVFLLQGGLIWMISVPLLVAQTLSTTSGLSAFDILGIAVWILGILFEAGGDWQLRRFKTDPRNHGRVLDTGLWALTRHPNYFGDAMVWWGFYLLAISAGGAWTVFSPVLMTALLLRVSGVTLLEKSLIETKPEYRRYIETTSAFLPWFRRRGT